MDRKCGNMSVKINKIRLKNYKRFRDYTITPNERINILIGDNEAGKSSILDAIDLVTSGNVHHVEKIGLDRLMNIEAVEGFLAGVHNFTNLPKMIIELYLNGDFDYTMNGKNNMERKECDGIRLVCEPNADYQADIIQALRSCNDYFPYDYYSIRFSTFADEGYSGYKNKIHCVMIDSSNMNSGHATNDFVARMYNRYTENNVEERVLHKSQYRLMRKRFQLASLKSLNERMSENDKYSFGLKGGDRVDIDKELMIYEENVGIDNKGTGKQIFVKTDFALSRSKDDAEIILLEEPENHLSHVNLRKLIKKILDNQTGQLFVTTHNSLISTRLELRNLLIMHPKDKNAPIMLNDLDISTAKYFMKAPPTSIVEFVLSSRVILLEGPSEYMLLEKFYKKILGNNPEYDNVHIICVRGLSFKRYLEVAQKTKSKVAVITDNDGNPQKNCIDRYKEYSSDKNIQVFYDDDGSKRTFEVVLYSDNVELCENTFGEDAQSYMLSHKTEAAYELLNESLHINVPNYIERAIKWIRE